MQMLIRTALLTLVLAAPVNAFGGEYGTAAEAIAMLDRATKAMKTDKSEALKRFNNYDPQFRDRDLFVFCFHVPDGEVSAHEEIVGANARLLNDGLGKWFGEEMYQRAREDQVSEVSYTSTLPGSNKRIEKRVFVTWVVDQVCGVSVYQLNGQKPTL